MLRFSTILSLMFSLAVVCAVSPTYASDVYINGVKANGALRDKTFPKASVHFDAQGNVHINVDGIKIREVEKSAGAQTKTPPTPKTRYLLVAEQTKPGIAQYSIDVHINKKLAVRIPYTKGQEIKDITEYLSPGSNEVTITAIKVLEGGRKSLSPNDTISIMIGEGSIQGTQVTLKNTELRYVRSAAEVAHDSKTFTLKTKP